MGGVFVRVLKPLLTSVLDRAALLRSFISAIFVALSTFSPARRAISLATSVARQGPPPTCGADLT